MVRRPYAAERMGARGPGGVPDCRTAGATRTEGSADALDDADVALGGVAELFEGGLIVRAVVGRGGLRDTVELDDDHALAQSSLVRLRRHAADEEAPARRLD